MLRTIDFASSEPLTLFQPIAGTEAISRSRFRKESSSRYWQYVRSREEALGAPDLSPLQIGAGDTAEVGRRVLRPYWGKSSLSVTRFVSLQKWEGAIKQVCEDVFTAVLYDKTQDAPDEEVEIAMEEVSEGDIDLVQPGAIFYWNIGYHDSRTGQRTRASIIRFRRLPVWKKDEIDAAKQEAARINALIGWE